MVQKDQERKDVGNPKLGVSMSSNDSLDVVMDELREVAWDYEVMQKERAANMYKKGSDRIKDSDLTPS